MATILRYPDDIIDSSTDYLRLEIIKYVPAGAAPGEGQSGLGNLFSTNQNIKTNTGGVSAAGGFTNRAASRLSGAKAEKTIILPIPGNIQDSNSAGWGEDRLSDAAAYGISQMGKAVESDSPEAALKVAMQVGKDFANASGSAAGSNIINYLKTAAVVAGANALGANTSVNGVLARASGQIINQNVEMLFNSVNIRTFNFAFNFVPRTKKEAKNVKDIIRCIKEANAPKAGSGDNVGFLNAPDVFRITYMKGGNTHPFLNAFKICALRNVSVNYTASNTYATYEDGTPIHMNMSLGFTELNPIYREDYDTLQDGANGVGY
jgi:hypothetical protein